MKTCPSCGSKYILGFRAGTQQIEEAVLREFPGTRVLRMDADTTRTKDSYEEILGAFANGEADILVGTQMIVKGHDFPNVTLVGILAADMSLHVGDYRSGERTFQLLTQAAGRAGRSGKSGEVVIQTYDPDHYSIVYAAKQDYKGFYEEEILYRKMLAYPPAAHMLAILTAARTEKEGLALAGEIATLVRNMEEGSREGREYAENRLYVIGPAPASVGKINDVYRFMLYVKHGEYGRLVEVKNRVEAFLEEREEKADKESETVENDVEKKAEKKERVQRGKETVQFDFDPMSAY